MNIYIFFPFLFYPLCNKVQKVESLEGIDSKLLWLYMDNDKVGQKKSLKAKKEQKK